MLDFDDAVALGKNKPNDGGRPLFYLHPVEVKKDGETFAEDAVWVKIFNIGDDKNIIERPKRDEDETRWPDHWKAYVENSEPPVDGTPIQAWPYLTPADVLNLKKIHVRSVEEIVGLPDNQLKKLGAGRGRKIHNEAKTYLEYKDVKDLRARIAELEKKLGNDKDDVPERVDREWVPDAIDVGREQQSGRKVYTAAGQEVSEADSEGTHVDHPDEGTRIQSG